MRRHSESVIIPTQHFYATVLLDHGVRVDLTHVTSLIFPPDVAYSQRPRSLFVVSHLPERGRALIERELLLERDLHLHSTVGDDDAFVQR